MRVLEGSVDVVQASWTTYSRAFGEAMVLLFNGGDRREALCELRRAREAVNQVIDHLPAEGLNDEGDLARRVAENLRAYIDEVVQEVSATRQ